MAEALRSESGFVAELCDDPRARDSFVERSGDDDPSPTFGVGDSLEDLREYYRLYVESMCSRGSPPHSFEFFRVLRDRLHDAGNFRLSTVHGDGAYEFGRTREKSDVYTFKKSFGGEKTWSDDRHYSPRDPTDLPDPEDEKYDQAEEVWRRLPLPVTRAVGPQTRKRIGP